jgi:cell wall-associated NlpC family hydrolase
MPSAAFKRLGHGERLYASSGHVAQVASLFANLYREPSVTKHQPLLTVPFETTLEVIREDDTGERWLEVRLPDDRPAWVQRGDVTLDPKAMSIEEVVALSQQFVGLPYFWGGTSSFGFDCSGFTQMLCRRRGTVIPRDTSLQVKWSGAAAVERNDLEPGDLLFFGESKVTHTGMYIGGRKFINATTHERPVVQISDLGDPYWTKRFIAARRLK